MGAVTMTLTSRLARYRMFPTTHYADPLWEAIVTDWRACRIALCVRPGGGTARIVVLP